MLVLAERLLASKPQKLLEKLLADRGGDRFCFANCHECNHVAGLDTPQCRACLRLLQALLLGRQFFLLQPPLYVPNLHATRPTHTAAFGDVVAAGDPIEALPLRPIDLCGVLLLALACPDLLGPNFLVTMEIEKISASKG